jgi:excisionase family DNA binding protein
MTRKIHAVKGRHEAAQAANRKDEPSGMRALGSINADPMMTGVPTTQETVAALERQKLAVTVEEAARLLSLNRTKVYALCMRGELRSVKIGRSRRIPVAALHEYLGVSA